MAGANEHTDVLSVIPASQTPSFAQLRALNPHLAVLFTDRLPSNSPSLNRKQIAFVFSTCCLVCSVATAAEAYDGGQLQEMKQRKLAGD